MLEHFVQMAGFDFAVIADFFECASLEFRGELRFDGIERGETRFVLNSASCSERFEACFLCRAGLRQVVLSQRWGPIIRKRRRPRVARRRPETRGWRAGAPESGYTGNDLGGVRPPGLT